MLRRRRRQRLVVRPVLVASTLVGAYLLLTILPFRSLPPIERSPPFAESYPVDHSILSPLREVDKSFYTVRINTWERPDQLIVSVNHHAKCPGAVQIQVVWCNDQHGEPPTEVSRNPKVVVERHTVNSLNERFNILTPTPTLGILSIDDDVMRPCEAIDAGFFKWTHNPHRMVGFDARLHVETPEKWAYGYMSTTEKANRYSLSLTRYCFLHRDYMNGYMYSMPKPIYQKVEKSFNCEDIAMSFYISSLTGGRPPLLADFWAIKSMIKLHSKTTISGTSGHKKIRDDCVDSFAEQLNLKGGPKSLQTAPIQHRKTPLFECGAEGNSLAVEQDDIKIPRYKALVKKVNHWKNSHGDIFKKEFSKMLREIAQPALERGLVKKV